MRLDNEAEPLSALLVADCLGCHTTTGTDPWVSPYPYVRLASGASDDNCLAGGFFQVTPDPSDNNGNENHDIGATALPAGYDTTETDWYTGDANGLGCAGTNGCHGNETDLDDMAAIGGEHHDPTAAYRMLYVDGTPVVGSGATDYEEAIIKMPTTAVVTSGVDQNVNIYSAGVEDPSISELCAKCHGDFHNEAGTTADVGSSSSVWLRHPTDVPIDTAWAIGNAGYTPDGDDYKNNPVGYDNAIFDISAKRVICVSCHRAHGTANDDLLRWPYSTQIAGGGNEYGCLGCHDKQR
jgi:predicted CXXCH cytochrome family protein